MTIGKGVHPTIGTIVSVNVGEPREVEWAGRRVLTAIWKWPKDGRISVQRDNLAGDAQADLRVHGGPDKALYTYAAEDYRWWQDQLGVALGPATFGENLTTEGVDLTTSVVGELWSVGTTLLQVTQPRMPCFKLGIRMADAAFVQRFDEARRLGVYCSIQDEGHIGAGDSIVLVARPAHGMTAASIAEIQDTKQAGDLRRLRDIEDVPIGWRDWANRQLTRADGRAGTLEI
jgi:MOSC domain-containing protein YiiM